MSTLQHVSQHTLRTRLGLRLVVAAAMAIAATVAVVVFLVIAGGDAKPAASGVTNGAASWSAPGRADVKYLTTHQRPAPDAVEQQSLQTDPKYLATHSSR